MGGAGYAAISSRLLITRPPQTSSALHPTIPPKQVGREIYGRRRLDEGFRNPALIRFVNGEDPYLSGNHGGPRMWINFGQLGGVVGNPAMERTAHGRQGSVLEGSGH